MAIDFPTATTVGQVYTDPTSGNSYVVTVVGPPAQWVGSGSSTDLSATFLRKDASNDPVTGTLTVTPATNVEGLVVTQPSGNSAAAMRITNEGSGNSLVIEDSANPDSSPIVADTTGRLLVGLTSANANGGVLQLSGGITFPATQVAATDPNTLDDYEEGTFTPTIKGMTVTGTGTYTAQIGRYTKIGNRVSISVRLAWSTHTGTGAMRMAGLPFTSNSTTDNIHALAGAVVDVPLLASNVGYFYVLDSTTDVILAQYAAGGGGGTTVSMDGSGTLVVCGTYEV